MQTEIMNWKPTQTYVVVFEDNTADRGPNRLEAMLNDVRKAANKHGFDFECHGTENAIKEMLVEKHAYVNRSRSVTGGNKRS